MVPDLVERPRYTVMAWGRLKFGLQYTSGSINDGNYGMMFFKVKYVPKNEHIPSGKKRSNKESLN